jgi:hypothetical protein
MTKLMLTVIVGVFMVAFTTEMMQRRRKRVHRMPKVVRDFRRAFVEGFGGTPGGVTREAVE